jgi:hypothetical protein
MGATVRDVARSRLTDLAGFGRPRGAPLPIYIRFSC